MGCTHAVECSQPDVIRAETLTATPDVDTSQKMDFAKGTPETREKFDLEYVLCNTLGNGSFGKVVAARERATGTMEAVKIVGTCTPRHASSKSAREQKRNLKVAAQEVEVWRSIGRHPNIVELRRAFCDNHCFLVVMEMCEGTVAEKLESNPDFLASGLPGLLYQMLLSIKACHAASVVHRDIKPANFLIGMDEVTVKLCDFNLSAQLPPDQGLVGEFGTPPFMSPEMLKAQRYGTGTDVWSYGSMAYFMLFGELPYVPTEITSKAAKAVVRAGVPLPRYLHGAPHQRGADSVDLCCQLLQRDPGQRCSAQDALEHPYFRAVLDVDKSFGVADTQSTVWSSTRRTSSRTSTQSTLHSLWTNKLEQHDEDDEQESDDILEPPADTC